MPLFKMKTRIGILEKQVAELKQELAHTIGERDEAINKAVEMMHINTYITEINQRKGLVCLK